MFIEMCVTAAVLLTNHCGRGDHFWNVTLEQALVKSAALFYVRHTEGEKQ